MFALIATFIIGLGVAYFAIQNTGSVTIQLDGAVWRDIPLYLVVVGSLLIGVFIAGFLSFIRSLSSRFALRGKDHALAEANKTIGDLTKRVHQLELENTKLQAGDEESALHDNSL